MCPLVPEPLPELLWGDVEPPSDAWLLEWAAVGLRLWLCDGGELVEVVVRCVEV
jgi:hypothetical protein